VKKLKKQQKLVEQMRKKLEKKGKSMFKISEDALKKRREEERKKEDKKKNDGK